MKAFLLQHIHHGVGLDSDKVLHRDEAGEVVYDEDLDDFKIVGIFSSTEAVMEARRKLMGVPGFRDEPECFIVEQYTVDETNWLDGFVTMQVDSD